PAKCATIDRGRRPAPDRHRRSAAGRGRHAGRCAVRPYPGRGACRGRPRAWRVAARRRGGSAAVAGRGADVRSAARAAAAGDAGRRLAHRRRDEEDRMKPAIAIAGAIGGIALWAAPAIWSAPVQDEPSAVVIQPQPLYRGCNSIVVSAPPGTAWSDVVAHIADPATVRGVWQFDNAA